MEDMPDFSSWTHDKLVHYAFESYRLEQRMHRQIEDLQRNMRDARNTYIESVKQLERKHDDDWK